MPAPTTRRSALKPERKPAPHRRSKRSALHYFTLNNGAIKDLHRQPLSRRTAATLSDLARRGGGSFAGILSAFSCRVEPALEVGLRAFWFLRNDTPILFGVACWDPGAADEAFGMAARVYYDLLLQSCCEAADPTMAQPDHAPAMPTRLPWLVRVMLPAIGELQARESIVLDELERCLAWTLLQEAPVTR